MPIAHLDPSWGACACPCAAQFPLVIARHRLRLRALKSICDEAIRERHRGKIVRDLDLTPPKGFSDDTPFDEPHSFVKLDHHIDARQR
jgi:hypothetical protein